MIISLKNKIVGAFNADFGSSYGFGTNVYYMIKQIWQRGYLNKAIFRDVIKSKFIFNYKLLHKAAPLGNFFPKVFTATQLYSKEKIRTTYYDQKFFDFFAKYKIPKIKNGILFSVLPNLQCNKRAKKLGFTNVISTVYHPEFGMDILETEYKKYNLPINPSHEKRIYNRHIESLKYADFIISPSEFTKNTFVDRGFDKEKIFVVPIGTDLKITTKKTHNQKLQFLFVANAMLTKGLQYLIEAWKNCKIDDAELVICGSIPPETEKIVMDDIKRIQNIKYIGFVSNLTDYYQSASVFILPSILEGMPRVVADAMTFELPVITTSISGPQIKNGFNGIIVPNRDINSLKDAIMHFYNNREEITKMGKNAANTVKNLTWENFSKELADVFEKISSRL